MSFTNFSQLGLKYMKTITVPNSLNDLGLSGLPNEDLSFSNLSFTSGTVTNTTSNGIEMSVNSYGFGKFTSNTISNSILNKTIVLEMYADYASIFITFGLTSTTDPSGYAYRNNTAATSQINRYRLVSDLANPQSIQTTTPSRAAGASVGGIWHTVILSVSENQVKWAYQASNESYFKGNTIYKSTLDPPIRVTHDIIGLIGPFSRLNINQKFYFRNIKLYDKLCL
jgi:hypothetical protein